MPAGKIKRNAADGKISGEHAVRAVQCVAFFFFDVCRIARSPIVPRGAGATVVWRGVS
jgi:hypothetical protein